MGRTNKKLQDGTKAIQSNPKEIGIDKLNTGNWNFLFIFQRLLKMDKYDTLVDCGMGIAWMLINMIFSSLFIQVQLYLLEIEFFKQRIDVFRQQRTTSICVVREEGIMQRHRIIFWSKKYHFFPNLDYIKYKEKNRNE